MMRYIIIFSLVITLLTRNLFSQSSLCSGIVPQQELAGIATQYSVQEEEFMFETKGEVVAFQMLDFYNPDATYFSSSLKNEAAEKIEYSWLPETGHLHIKQKFNGLFFTPVDRSFSCGNTWQIFVNTKSNVESAESFNGLYMKARVTGENFDRYILLLGNKQSSSYWFGEYNTSTKTYTSFNVSEISDCNFITHPSVQEYGSVDYSIYRNGRYLFLRINSHFLYNYEITPAMTAFNYITEAGVVSFNAQETEVTHVQWNNFSGMTGVSLEQYEQKSNSLNNNDSEELQSESSSGSNKLFYGTYVMYYGNGDFVTVTNAYQVYANEFPSESELEKIQNDKIDIDAPDTGDLIGTDFIPDQKCEQTFEILKGLYIEADLENYSTDYCMGDYELDN